ncbi:MAG: hypothetical protein DHS20C14_01530 [Phycisphaeraceae bacterium]|nr:MAG: hypothetical protein DHS20C14_01530 [Phycisphaeraceae bacterium]
MVLNQGEASVREIAAQLGRHPASLYKHIDHLEEIGLIQEVGTKATGKRDARVFASDAWYLNYDVNNEEIVEALLAYMHSELRNSGRRLDDALHDETSISKGSHRDTRFISVFAWLTRSELGELNRLLNEMMDLMMDKPRRPKTKLVAWTHALFPMRMGSRAVEPKD